MTSIRVLDEQLRDREAAAVRTPTGREICVIIDVWVRRAVEFGPVMHAIARVIRQSLIYCSIVVVLTM